MEIKHIAEGNRGFFGAYHDAEQMGMITYSMAGETKMILDHTEVNEKYAGQGVGKSIVLYIVDYARKNNLKILPLCPFAKSVFDKTKEIHDVLF